MIARFFAILLLCACVGLAPAGAQMTTTGIGQGGTGGGGGGAGCSQATTWLSGKTTTWSAAYTTLICGLVSDGTYGSFDRFYILATDNSTNALADIITNAAATITGTATFTANSGYVSDGTTGTLNTGLNYSTATHYKQNSAVLMAWPTAGATQDNGCPIGAAAGGSFALFFQTFSFGSSAGGAMNGFTIPAGTTGTGTGMFAADVSSSTNIALYFNGVSNATATGTSSAPPNATAQGFECDAGTFFAHNVGFIAVGASLGATNEASVYARVHTFLHTVNASLYP